MALDGSIIIACTGKDHSGTWMFLFFQFLQVSDGIDRTSVEQKQVSQKNLLKSKIFECENE